MIRALALPLLAGAILTGAGSAPASPPTRGAGAAAVRDCNLFVAYPNTRITSARNMSCRTARRELRRYRRSIRRRFRTPGGFSCRRVSGGRARGRWRCTRGARGFRFVYVEPLPIPQGAGQTSQT